MRIHCPHCGDRDISEFHCHGSAVPRRPETSGVDTGNTDGSARMVDYVYLRDNPAGMHEELWYHGFGCRAWLVVTRNTLTHEIANAGHAARRGAG
jgi:sarcosine oxidase subunit delta